MWLWTRLLSGRNPGNKHLGMCCRICLYFSTLWNAIYVYQWWGMYFNSNSSLKHRYLNLCCLFVHRHMTNTFWWNLNQNTKISIQKSWCNNVVCKLSVSMYCWMGRCLISYTSQQNNIVFISMRTITMISRNSPVFVKSFSSMPGSEKSTWVMYGPIMWLPVVEQSEIIRTNIVWLFYMHIGCTYNIYAAGNILSILYLSETFHISNSHNCKVFD